MTRVMYILNVLTHATAIKKETATYIHSKSQPVILNCEYICSFQNY